MHASAVVLVLASELVGRLWVGRVVKESAAPAWMQACCLPRPAGSGAVAPAGYRRLSELHLFHGTLAGVVAFLTELIGPGICERLHGRRPAVPRDLLGPN